MDESEILLTEVVVTERKWQSIFEIMSTVVVVAVVVLK
jgi:hypothetical protein